MVDNCRHVLRLSPAANHSVLNPQKWACNTCGTTESVWACLSCPNVACGRYISEHAVKHYKETKHALSLEVNEKYVYCYECDDYVLNDNAAGDIKILRCALSAVTSQSLRGLPRQSKRILRSQSFTGFDAGMTQRLAIEDRNYTALWFRRYYLLAKAFTSWKQAAGISKQPETSPQTSPQKSDDCHQDQVQVNGVLVSQTPARKRRALIPGVTGLRNLGNTCYMNSVLQVLRYLLSYSHLQDFRDFMLKLKEQPSSSSSPPSSSGQSQAALQASTALSPSQQSSRKPKSLNLMRQTTMECFQHVNEKKGGLNGGSSKSPAMALQKLANTKDALDNVSLCQELHALLRVMWSGKWAQVSPHKMLQAVWNIIPFFRGYSQQDAQEFLCEFLDKVSTELESGDHTVVRHIPTSFQDVVTSLFQGQLISEVTCLHCKNKSKTFEAFMDLSLEFPQRCQGRGPDRRKSSQPCHLEEMLTKFTDIEKLDGCIYACESCNFKRRRKASPRATNYTEAHKQFTIHKLPHVLRLHLKRFMWSGRNNRGKITVHADFEELLDLKPFCHEDLKADSYLYQLSAVVMHHGRGFGSGHYTAYCWNEEADSWVHCNDAKMQLVSLDEVMKCQAYILFYTRGQKSEISDADLAFPLDNTLFERVADEEITFNFKNSSIPRFVELKRKLSMDGLRGQRELKRRKSNMW